MSIQSEIKRCMKERYPYLYSDLYFDFRLYGSKKNEGLIQDEITEYVLYVNAKKNGSIFYAPASPDETLECYDVFTEIGHTVQSVSELCDGLAAKFFEIKQLDVALGFHEDLKGKQKEEMEKVKSIMQIYELIPQNGR